MKLNKKMVTGIGGGVIAVVVVILLATGSARKKEAEKYETEKKMTQNNLPRPARFEEVKVRPAETPRSYPGIVKASEESALSFRVGGPLTEVNVRLGEPVKKDDLLMQIDPRDFKDRIASLEAQLAGAVAVRDNAQQDFKRVSELYLDKVVSQSDYDHAKSVIDSAEAAVKNLNAQLQIARHALEDTSLRAPYDGTVSAQMVENHEMVKSGEVVMHFHNIRTLEVTVNVPENEMANAPINAADMAVSVSFPALHGQEFAARVKEWSTNADPLTRTYAATFEFEVPEGVRVFPGMTAKVQMSNPESNVMVLTVPVSALVSGRNGETSVWVIEGAESIARLCRVVVGSLEGDSRVVITEGLSEGDRVIVTGSRLIHENLPLKTASTH